MQDSYGCRTRLQKKIQISSLGLKCYKGRQHDTFHNENLENEDKPKANIWRIPPEILESIFTGLHITDLLSLLCTHTHLNQQINTSNAIWKHVSFSDLWPTKSYMKHFERASSYGNFEATVKLGIAYLYNEGLPQDEDGSHIESNGRNAAKLLSAAEEFCKETCSFTWLFFRPPWSVQSCCKEVVYKSMKEMVLGGNATKNVLDCVAKVAMMSDDLELTKRCLIEAKEVHSSVTAAYSLWCLQKSQCLPTKELSDIEWIRNLRSIVAMGKHHDANLSLVNAYMEGKCGSLDRCIAAQFTSDFIQSSTINNLKPTFSTHTPITPSMRYILVDWLVEVAIVKNFSTHTLHQSIYLMDNYMVKKRSIARCKLQLLGVACLVICSRFTSSDVITIWEACWLTDNTYKYEDVVKMMADIVVTQRGQIRVLVARDYIMPINTILGGNLKQLKLADYICELALLQTELSIYPQATLAASCVLLSQTMTGIDEIWTDVATAFTGYQIDDLRQCVLHIHEKCFVEEAPTDHRDVKLYSVKTRYNTEKLCYASSIQTVSREILLSKIGGDGQVDEWYPNSTYLRLRTQPYHIMSPSRKGKRFSARHARLNSERDNAGTPTLPRRKSPNDSILSGHEGDREDMNESVLVDDDPNDSDTDEDYDEYFAADREIKCVNQVKNEKRSISIQFISPMGAISSHSPTLRVNQSGIHLDSNKSAFSSVLHNKKYYTRFHIEASNYLTSSGQIKRKTTQNEGRLLKPKVQH